jgi:hypothetical protein
MMLERIGTTASHEEGFRGRARVPKGVRTAKCGSARHVDDRRRTGLARDSQSRAIHLYVKDAHSTYQRAFRSRSDRSE